MEILTANLALSALRSGHFRKCDFFRDYFLGTNASARKTRTAAQHQGT